ncbi:DNA-directed RNA polymerase subunit E'' [Candidatus Woesearchaeota archaeon]|nr:DNA-directed RNA polymerase subunit E'' [Candidatus Woesearchaeota archaeon]
MKRVCKQCKVFFEEGNCPLCKNSDFATTWQGRINIIDPEKSLVAKKTCLKSEGDYAIKIR